MLESMQLVLKHYFKKLESNNVLTCCFETFCCKDWYLRFVWLHVTYMPVRDLRGKAA
jgi:hypothetical protein